LRKVFKTGKIGVDFDAKFLKRLVRDMQGLDLTKLIRKGEEAPHLWSLSFDPVYILPNRGK